MANPNRKLHKSLKRFSNQKEQKLIAISGELGLPLNGQKLVEVPNRKGFVFVRLRNNTSEVIQAYNSEVSTIYGLAVLVARQNNIYKVIGRDLDRYKDWGNIPYLPKHGGQHSFLSAFGMGADVTWIGTQQFMPLLGYPSGSNGSDGITVAPYIIQDLAGNFKYVGDTGTPNITQYRPTTATGAIMVLVYVDTVSGNPYLLVGSGTMFHAGLTGSSDIARYIPPVTNPNWIPDVAVRLTTGTTQITWNNLYDVRPFLRAISTGTGGSGGGATGSFDSTYLRLDTSNDPLTGNLQITPSNDDEGSLSIQSMNDAVTFGMNQFATGSAGVSSAGFFANRQPLGTSTPTFSGPLMQLAQSRSSGTISGKMASFVSDNTERIFFDVSAQGTGTNAMLDGDYTLSPGGLLLLLKNRGVSRFYVNASGTAHSNGVPLIKEAPVDGNQYARKNAGWEQVASASTGTSTALVEDLTSQINGVQTRFTLSYPVSPNGILLLYNGVAQLYGVHFVVSGTFVNTLFTPTTGSTMQSVEMGVFVTGSSSSLFIQDEGVPLGTASTLNVVGNNADISISGSVARLFVTGSSTSPEHAYYQFLAASLEPQAIYPLLSNTFSYTVTGSSPQMILASFATQMGTTGRMEVRHPEKFMLLPSGTTIQGTLSTSAMVLLNPQLPAYSNSRTTYYDRLNQLANMQYRKVDINAVATSYPFLLGAYGGILVRSVNFDYDYISIQNSNTTNGLNLDNEINDGSTQRIDSPLILSLNKLVATELYSGAGGAGKGSVVFVLCPSTWSVIPDNTSYIFRDDFMGASLQTKWSVTGTACQINQTYQWASFSGTSTWGANGAYSQTSFSRASGTVFVADWYTGRNATAVNSHIVGFSDRLGHSYTNFSHGVLFTSTGAANVINVFENGNNRGQVGSGYSNGTIYRIRITITGNLAKYEIQGGEYGALGGPNWTNITPGTTSSSTTPLSAGFSVGQTGIMYLGDVKVS